MALPKGRPPRSHLVLLLQDLGRLVGLLVGDVYALEAVDVTGKAALADVSLSGVDGLGQGVVDKNVLKKRGHFWKNFSYFPQTLLPVLLFARGGSFAF